jgi:hypothetical protein
MNGRSAVRPRLPLALGIGALVVALATPAHATRYAGEFLRIGVGARALGMGSAFVGLADDGTAAYWNPAGIATLERHEITAMHAEQFGSIVQYDFLSYVMPIGSPGGPKQGLGFSLVRLGVDDIPDTRGLEIIFDQNQNGKFDYPEDRLAVDESRFVFDSDNDVALLISYARDLKQGFSVGGNFKIIRQWLGDSLRSTGFGLDAGALWVGDGWSAGARLSDAVTTRILWNTGTSEYIAPALRIGGAKTKSFASKRHVVTAALDVQIGFSDEVLSSQANIGSVTFEFHPGIEYWIERRVALRAGFESRNFSAGAGVRLRRFGLDYAYLDHADLDASHRVSGSYNF